MESPSHRVAGLLVVYAALWGGACAVARRADDAAAGGTGSGGRTGDGGSPDSSNLGAPTADAAEVSDTSRDAAAEVSDTSRDAAEVSDTSPGEASGTRPGLVTAAWPGGNAVGVVDRAGQFGANLSGLFYQAGAGGAAAAVLWAVQNDPSLLHRLVPSGATWTGTASDGWAAGKALRYPGGQGAPDAEGVTRAELTSTAIYVAAERDNDAKDTSRRSVLRFDTAATGATLTATNEWNVTADWPSTDPNVGIEGITWVPDTSLVAAGFVDESTGAAYAPARYANHGTGLFLVASESNGAIHAYALDHAAGGTFHRVAVIASGQAAIMDLAYDRDVGYLWAQCDNTCDNKASVLQIDGVTGSATRGRFQVWRFFDRPSTLGNLNGEGIALAPESECAGGRKAFFWSDDDETGDHALRRDSIPCGAFIAP